MNSFLLDTNIPSELMRVRPEPRITHWMHTQPESSLFLSVVTVGELRKGIHLLGPDIKGLALESWLQKKLIDRFRGRILPVTQPIAERWGILESQCKSRGTPLNTADGMIAATALEYGMTIVTRNVRDFMHLGVPLINPWEL